MECIFFTQQKTMDNYHITALNKSEKQKYGLWGQPPPPILEKVYIGFFYAVPYLQFFKRNWVKM